MNKIPSLYLRDFDGNPRYLTRTPNPDCQWVFDGEGVATRKWDGTCVLIRDGKAFARRQVKPGKDAPPNFEATEHDERTGITYGWEPASQSGFARFIDEALAVVTPMDGTYELCGPAIQGNPEKITVHVLLRHGTHPWDEVPTGYDHLGAWLHHMRASYGMEGVVWHHPDGRMAKVKVSDFEPKETKP